jgi:hypothetical protein
MNTLHWMIQFAFGCHHRHISRVFTIDKRTYKVCLDCGHEFRLPDASLGTSIDEDSDAFKPSRFRNVSMF